MSLVLVLVLGGAGAVLRALSGRAWNRDWPLGTLAVNLGASFALGLTSSWDGPPAVGLQIGLLGALSTWSTLANEVATLHRDGRSRDGAVLLAVSLVGGVTAAWAGLQLAG